MPSHHFFQMLTLFTNLGVVRQLEQVCWWRVCFDLSQTVRTLARPRVGTFDQYPRLQSRRIPTFTSDLDRFLVVHLARRDSHDDPCTISDGAFDVALAQRFAFGVT